MSQVTCYSQEALWEQYNADLKGLADQRARFIAVYQNQTNVDSKRLVSDLIKNVQDAEAKLLKMQAEVEVWLVENGCKGWSST